MNGQSAAKPLSLIKYKEGSTTISMKESREEILETEGFLLSEWQAIPAISGLYLIKNIINNKIYIGISKNIRKRCKEHFYTYKGYKSRNGSKLKNALLKYKIEDFRFFILEITEEDLVKKEAYYINKFDSVKNGYNIREYDLDYTSKFKQTKEAIEKVRNINQIPILVFDLEGNFIEKINGCSDAAIKYNYCRRTINESVCNNDKVFLLNKKYFLKHKNHIFIREKSYDGRIVISFKNRKLNKNKI